LARTVLPRVDPRKLAVAALVGALAGCGGRNGTAPQSQRSLQGDGYSVSVPPGWKVNRSGRVTQARDGASLVSVTRFRLVRPYTAALFPKVSRELDGVASQLARAEHGKLAKSETITIAGRRARAYTIDRGGREERVAFVLAGRREFQLFCRYERGSRAEAACSSLFSSFRLA
jgi:hypothetical protein